MESKNSDWHPADIIAGLRKRGTSLAAESRKAGLSSSTLANALTRPWRYYDPQTDQFIDRACLMRKR
jgi:Ner family transcriptional regulator